MEGPGHRFLLGQGQTSGIGVKRAREGDEGAEGKISQRAGASRKQKGGPGPRRTGQGLGNAFSSAQIPARCFQEHRKMEGSGVGGWGEPGGGQGLDRDERRHRSPWALHAEGCCGGLPGGRGGRGR